MTAPTLTPERVGLGETIPVIGLWQPYATLVAIKAKPWETRHFPPPSRLQGKRVAIQATLRKPTRDDGRSRLTPARLATYSAKAGRPASRMVPLSAPRVISCAYQVRDYFNDGTVALGGLLGPWFPDDGFGDYTPGRWCWGLSNVRALIVPIPLKGRQDVGWPWTPDAEQRTALATETPQWKHLTRSPPVCSPPTPSAWTCNAPCRRVRVDATRWGSRRRRLRVGWRRWN